MSIGNRQIGWSNESNLLWNISKQLERLTGVTFTSLSSLAPTYKVYTALLTQSGGDVLDQLDETTPTQNVTKGVTYTIDTASDGDFLNVGAPNNNTGTSFVAINNSVPTSWGQSGASLLFNTGAPVVTVLENTIGDIWFTYDSVGLYTINSNNLFTSGKTFVINGMLNSANTSGFRTFYELVLENSISIVLFDNAGNAIDGIGSDFPIEIRVYN